MLTFQGIHQQILDDETQRGRNKQVRWHKPPSRKPTLLDIAWAAGFIEGEGCFQLESNGTSGRVVACQKDPELLLRLQEMFGGSVKLRSPRHNGLSDADIYDWVIYGRRAVGVIYTIFTFLSTKRRAQARSVVVRLVANGKWKRERVCACGAIYMPWKNNSRACSAKCYARWFRRNRVVA